MQQESYAVDLALVDVELGVECMTGLVGKDDSAGMFFGACFHPEAVD